MRAVAKAKELGLILVPNVFVDSGVENINANVDRLVSDNLISRTIAQIEIEFSHSMIEMLFLRMKHPILFTIPLTSLAALTKGVYFYLTESNTATAHSALKGATPEEFITGRWTQEKILEMQGKVATARWARIAANKSQRCQPCLG
jgi:hypothetical protein